MYKNSILISIPTIQTLGRLGEARYPDWTGQQSIDDAH